MTGKASPRTALILSVLLAMLVSAGPSAIAAKPDVPSKKGVSTWFFDDATAALTDSRVSWYYTWDTNNIGVEPPAGVEFVPMIWGADSVTPERLDEAATNGTTLLGFNEPDLPEQANMPVDQALELWPQLQSTGLRLGSPAVAHSADVPGGWLHQFMTGAAERGYRVDFIALHWYGSDFGSEAVNHLRDYLVAVYERYRLPIWLTEYSLIDFAGGPAYPPPERQASFAKESGEMLNSLSFVERYAWFALPEEGIGTGLYPGPKPNVVGAAYRDVP